MLPTKEGNVELGVPLVLSEILLLYPAELNLGLGLVKGVKESWFSTMFSLFPDSLHSVGFAFVVAGSSVTLVPWFPVTLVACIVQAR